ncbi:secreted RxLR effector protein 161-like [Pistacia vera]|uniref:secreted RxLR effector protein 161-like n=1 Tax=Pistacia vera TaxID=55513 RepID=UPI0012631E29|nr:secreted RxLR effector protein 161-like [Pistacia vera]
MKDLGVAKKILGMMIDRDRSRSTLKVHQTPYLQKLVTKYGMSECKPVTMPLANHFILTKSQCPKSPVETIKMEIVPYSNLIGSVMYVMISTRPDLAFAISLLSRFMSNPGSDHWIALKWVLRYINCTACIGLEYCKRTSTLDLVGFVDSDFAGDRHSRKSTTAYCFTLGGNCISWESQLQPLVALSMTEAEYVALADGFKEAIWMQGLLTETELTDSKVTIFSDSQSAILLSKNPIYHERTKHVDMRFYFIRDLITRRQIDLTGSH